MDMPNTAAIEALRSFALDSKHATGSASERRAACERMVAFAHMCTAALNREAWAVERVTDVLADLTFEGRDSTPLDVQGERVLRIILTTDCTRPDGEIARSV